MNNVIRKDVIQVGLDSNDMLSALKKINDEINSIKKSFGILDDDKPMEKTKEQTDKTKESVEKTQKQTEKLKETLDRVGKTSFNKVTAGLKKVGTVAVSVTKATAKATVAGIGAASAGVAAMVASSVKAYGDYEQLTGGVQTLFGAGGADTVEKYAKNVGKSVSKVQSKFKVLKETEAQVYKDANDAYKTAGLSANEYMETVTGFSASLIASLKGDTKKAAGYSNKAIVDMADNANKMGSSMESIQNAYQGFAKQNYTMLDNLKLGYGGTQEEMKRLIKDAAKIDKAVKANDMSFGNIVLAIHAIQDSMDITGTTAKEASTTIQGSFSSLKSAWGNLMTSLVVGGDSFDQCLANLVDSAKIFGKNVMPAIRKALSGVGDLIVGLSPYIEAELPGLIDDLLPPLLKAATALVKALIKALPGIIKTLVKEFPDIAKQIGQAINETFGKQLEPLKKIGALVSENAAIIAAAIKKFAPPILGLIGAFMALKKVQSVSSVFSGLFGKSKSGKSIGIFGQFQKLAKMKTKAVLHGMANLAIIVGGMTVIGAALMAVSPYMAQLTDVKSLVKLLGSITAITGVGTVLAKAASIVGNIPIGTVVKGLANMAIMLGGMTAVTSAMMIVTPYIAQLTSTKAFVKVMGTITILGIVGSVLSVFAGIVGSIPISVVLAGLANIALVISGFTAIITAFGALSRIEGFNDFINSGGELLSDLLGQIGKIGGSLIGGVGEGITKALPKIGQNLTGFAASIKPMFTLFNGVDVKSIGSFFGAIGTFLLTMAGESIVSIFAGETDFAKLGLQLTEFANNSSGFFTKVAKFPANGFANAKALFKSLADIGNIPNTGGIAQWFSGTNDFEGLSTGLGQLASAGVSKFYTTVGKIPQESFNGAKLLFKSLADIGNIPNTGGAAQWFSGENDFSGLAAKLPVFGVAMAKFYNSISGISNFSKLSGLFKAMKGIGEAFPNTGGIAQLFSGENDISGVGESLRQFGLDTRAFFTQVNTLNIGKLNGLWQSIKTAGSIASTNISLIVDENINNIVSKVSELPKKMGDAVRNSGDSLAAAIVEVWKKAVNKSAAPVNKLLDGANWILKEFGSSKRVAKWTPYAKGTDGHKGGNALVNDGRGAELVQMPNGNTFIPKGRNVFIPNAPKGMKVLSAENTANVMGKKSPTFKYAKGNIDIWEYLDNAKGLIGKVKEKYVNYKGVTGLALSIGKGMVSTISGEMIPWVKKLCDEFGALSLANYNPSGGVEQWRSTVIRALQMEGQYNAANVARTLRQMQTESGGNPKAINLWDSNAKKGIPSKGLMQVIDPTFAAYARPGFNKNIYDPLSNILASIRYAVSRYGSLANAYRGVGYANGGIATKPSIFGEKGAEMAIPLTRQRNRALGLWQQTGNILGAEYTPENSSIGTHGSAGGNYSISIDIHVDGTGKNDREVARAVKQAAKEAIIETFESFKRKNPRFTEA